MSYTTLWIATKHCWIRLCVECLIAQAMSVGPHLRNSQVGQVAGHSPKTSCWDFIPNPIKLKTSRPRSREVFRRRVYRTLFSAALFRSLKTKIGKLAKRGVAPFSGATATQNSPDAQASGLLFAHTWNPCIEVRPSGFLTCFYVPSAVRQPALKRS